MAATEAYEVLSNPEQRRHYDELQRVERVRAEQSRLKDVQRKAAGAKGRQSPQSSTIAGQHSPPVPSPSSNPNAVFQSGGNRPSMTVEVTRLTMLFTRGQNLDAERLARKIIERDGRQPIPYAVLGDLHRQRGELAQAGKMYAYAVQMDPRNALYQQRYEEIAGALNLGDNLHLGETSPTQMAMPVVGGALVLLAGMYLILSREAAIVPHFSPISSWTLGLVVMLFLSGVFLGSTFSVGNLLDRFSTVTTSTTGRLSPSVALAVIAIANFWVAAVMYMVLGIVQSAYNFSTSRIVAAVAAGTVVIALAAALSNHLDGLQTFCWGGNVMYVGALCGWMVADSFRR